MWLYGSGFPKSMNIGLAIDKKNGVESKIVGKGKSGGTSRAYQSPETTTAGEYQVKEAQNEWAGWGTALKPSYEPIVVSRKPLDGSCVVNVMKWGVGGLNIDECRIETSDKVMTHSKTSAAAKSKGVYGDYGAVTTHQTESQKLGRFPANTILDTQDGEEWRRYFYCAKASKNDRDEGLEEFSTKTSGQMTERKEGSAGITAFTGSRSPKKNNHPTVKPTELMRYLVRLVTPKGGTVLDPFMGSGTTGVVAKRTDRDFIGIELDENYFAIAQERIQEAK
jgi:site-specific DNA-methyltransferase (adenine-specific)